MAAIRADMAGRQARPPSEASRSRPDKTAARRLDEARRGAANSLREPMVYSPAVR